MPCWGPGYYIGRKVKPRACCACGHEFRPMAPNQRICGREKCKQELRRQAAERATARATRRALVPR